MRPRRAAAARLLAVAAAAAVLLLLTSTTAAAQATGNPERSNQPGSALPSPAASGAAAAAAPLQTYACAADDACCPFSGSPQDCQATAASSKGCRSELACVPAEDPCRGAANEAGCVAAGPFCKFDINTFACKLDPAQHPCAALTDADECRAAALTAASGAPLACAPQHVCRDSCGLCAPCLEAMRAFGRMPPVLAQAQQAQAAVDGDSSVLQAAAFLKGYCHAAAASVLKATSQDALLAGCSRVADDVLLSPALLGRPAALCSRLNLCQAACAPAVVQHKSPAASKQQAAADAIDLCSPTGLASGANSTSAGGKRQQQQQQQQPKRIDRAAAKEGSVCLSSADCPAGLDCDTFSAPSCWSQCDPATGMDTCAPAGQCVDICSRPDIASAVEESRRRIRPCDSSSDCRRGETCGEAPFPCSVVRCNPLALTAREPPVSLAACPAICLPEAPRMLGARFTDAGDAIEVQLNQEAAPLRALCGFIFDSDTSALLGAGSICTTSGDTLTIWLAGPDVGIRPDVQGLALSPDNGLLTSAFGQGLPGGPAAFGGAIKRVAACRNCSASALGLRLLGPSELSLACANDPASAQAVFDEELLATSANLAPGIDSLATPDGFLYSVQLQGGAWWSVANLTWSLETKEDAKEQRPNGTDKEEPSSSSGVEALQALLAEVNARPEAWQREVLVLPYSLLQALPTGRPLTLRVAVTNIFDAASAASLTFSKTNSTEVPLFELDKSINRFIPSAGFRLQAAQLAPSACPNMRVNWHWSTSLPGVDLSDAASSNVGVPPAELVGRVKLGETYTLTLTASYDGSPASASDTISLTAIGAPLSVNLTGPAGTVPLPAAAAPAAPPTTTAAAATNGTTTNTTGTTSSSSSVLTWDARGSIDPDDPHSASGQLSYLWSCTNTDDLSPCFGDATPDGRWSLDTAQLQDGVRYIISVTVAKGDRSSTASRTIVPMRAGGSGSSSTASRPGGAPPLRPDAPSAQLVRSCGFDLLSGAPLPCPALHNPNEPLTLVAVPQPPFSLEDMLFSWALDEVAVPNGMLLHANNTLGGVRRPSLTVLPDALPNGGAVTLNLNFSLSPESGFFRSLFAPDLFAHDGLFGLSGDDEAMGGLDPFAPLNRAIDALADGGGPFGALTPEAGTVLQPRELPQPEQKQQPAKEEKQPEQQQAQAPATKEPAADQAPKQQPETTATPPPTKQQAEEPKAAQQPPRQLPPPPSGMASLTVPLNSPPYCSASSSTERAGAASSRACITLDRTVATAESAAAANGTTTTNSTEAPAALANTTTTVGAPGARFRACAVGWADPEGGLLAYEFGTLDPATKQQRPPLASAAGACFMFVGLPPGPSTLYACAVDPLGARACQEADVAVLEPTTAPSSDEIKSKLIALQDQLASEGASADAPTLVDTARQMTSLIKSTTTEAVHSIFDLVDDLVGGVSSVVGGVTSMVGDLKKVFGPTSTSGAPSTPLPPPPAPTTSGIVRSKRINLLVDSAAAPSSAQLFGFGRKKAQKAAAQLAAANASDVGALAAANASTTLLRLMADAGSVKDPEAALSLLSAGEQLAAAAPLTPAGGMALIDLFSTAMTASGSTPKQLTQQQSTALANALLRGVDAAATPHSSAAATAAAESAAVAVAAAGPEAKHKPARSLLQAVVDAAANGLAPRQLLAEPDTNSTLALLSPEQAFQIIRDGAHRLAAAQVVQPGLPTPPAGNAGVCVSPALLGRHEVANFTTTFACPGVDMPATATLPARWADACAKAADCEAGPERVAAWGAYFGAGSASVPIISAALGRDARHLLRGDPAIVTELVSGMLNVSLGYAGPGGAFCGGRGADSVAAMGAGCLAELALPLSPAYNASRSAVCVQLLPDPATGAAAGRLLPGAVEPVKAITMVEASLDSSSSSRRRPVAHCRVSKQGLWVVAQFDPQASSKAGGAALSSGLKASLATGSPSGAAAQAIPGAFSDEETKVDGKAALSYSYSFALDPAATLHSPGQLARFSSELQRGVLAGLAERWSDGPELADAQGALRLGYVRVSNVRAGSSSSAKGQAQDVLAADVTVLPPAGSSAGQLASLGQLPPGELLSSSSSLHPSLLAGERTSGGAAGASGAAGGADQASGAPRKALGGGAAIGIIIGCVAALAVLTTGVVLLMRRRGARASAIVGSDGGASDAEEGGSTSSSSVDKAAGAKGRK